jgi:hypothetical protein
MKLFSKASRDGYVMIDHRDSPGLEGKVENGFRYQHVPGGTMFEGKTFTCPRCHKVIVKNPDRGRNRGYCRKCDHDVCDSCALMLKLNHTCSKDTCRHVLQVHLGLLKGA